MKVLTGDPGFWGPAPGSGTALTVGVFDGVHLGHQALLTERRGIAAAEGLETVVVTFDVHPKRFFDPDGGPTLLVSLSRRLELLEEAGVDQVGVLPFADIRTWGPDQFVRRVMVDGFRARSVLVGEGFRYGAGRAGNQATLKASGQEHGFSVRATPLLQGGSAPVSSSTIRGHIAAGEVKEAAELLGRPHEIAGTWVAIIKPKGIKVKVDRCPISVPEPGLYYVGVKAGDEGFAGICRIPPVKKHFEVHPFGMEAYLRKRPKRLTMSFVGRIKG